MANTNLEQTISVRHFSLADQIEFANFSGDINPIHVEPIAARRTMTGRCIVHGMHSLLWALDELAKTNIVAKSLKVRFLRPIFLNEDIHCIWNEKSYQLALRADDTTLVTISLILGEVAAEHSILGAIECPRSMPDEPTFSECAEMSRRPLKFYGNATLARELFPSACELYGLATVCEIGSLSELVGMECPGLHSLFSSLQLQIESKRNKLPTFGVVESDGRFNLLRISVEGHTIGGEIEAFYRPSPTRNRPLSELAAYVQKGEFENVCALIVGGSRGLGELVAKLIAAGGGKSIITYNFGQIEAEQLVEEILAYGERCTAFQLTVSDATTLPIDLPNFNQLYYFATPKILEKRSDKFDEGLYKEFQEIYVNGFESICNQINNREIVCSVLYPSTIFINQPSSGLSHYVKAKMQGEILCQRLSLDRRLSILVPRLPRMATDQNQSLAKVDSADPVEVMLPLLRELRNQ